MDICETLYPIYKLELDLGNTVKNIEAPAGAKCPYAVTFASQLHFKEIEKQLTLSSSVDKWKNTDRHYPLQAGYFCNKYKHSIAGPA